MRKGFWLLMVCMTIVASAGAVTPGPVLHRPSLQQGEQPYDRSEPAFTYTRLDTAWFGGDNGQGIGIVGGVWDFESPGSNGFQGCISWDQTENPGVYFGHVNSASFTAHGDPCTPMISGTAGMIWCGIHEDEASQRDFVAGMGYQNEMCQSAFSPIYAIAPQTQTVDLALTYFAHSEPGFDYTYVNVLCYDTLGDLIEEHQVAVFDGVLGDYTVPALYDEGVEVPAGSLPPATTHIKIEFRMEADGGWSDEDGNWDTPCGPFAADDVSIAVGGSVSTFDFNNGPQGWTFNKCVGSGAHMHIVHDYEYEEWLDDLGLTCACTLTGDAIAFVSTICQNGAGLVPGQKEQFETGTIARAGYPAPYWNEAVVEYDGFMALPHETGAHYRPGYRRFPFTSESNPVAHWSPRQGQALWYYTSSPYCGRNVDNLSTMADEPLPVDWDSLRYTFEVYVSCDGFTIPPEVCVEEGCTGGAPVIDNVRIGITNAADAPPISWVDGGRFQDGFGQNYPTYLEPSDRCNANVAYDNSRDNTQKNDWLADSSVVAGPLVTSAASRWLCQLCLKVAQIGPRQQMIPEYQTWRARLAGDPEDDFVCVLMDSLQTNNNTQVWKNKFASYFHENDPAFRGPGDYNEQNEILPDGVFTPGTRIEYYWRSYWYNGGVPPTDYFLLGANPNREMECLPMMELSPGEEFTVQWPSVLYVDAYDRGGEQFMLPALEQLGMAFDKYDYMENGSNYNAPLKRSLGGTSFNPGGYGNNGCTTEQLLGYRLVIFSNGLFGLGSCETPDFQLLDQWLATTSCGLSTIRRGLVMDGDQIAEVMADEVQGLGINFAHNILGVTCVASAYRDYNDDAAYCVHLEPASGSLFQPGAPGIAVWGNGCPQEYNYNVLGLQPGVSNVSGNLQFHSFEQTGTQSFVDYAQVVRQNQQTGLANWRSVVNGFSFHHLARRGCSGEPCSNDSICRVQGTTDLYGPMFQWLAAGATPFGKWLYPCFSNDVEPNQPHLSGPVNFLHAGRPNPFNSRATLRFSLATAGEVSLSVYDVSGRLVRTLLDGQAQAGESSVVWDGTDNEGNRVGGGIFWVQMSTPDGFTSGKKMVVLR